ncbi:MAG: PstS family phosphate ABC transporter substrate-binding protein [Mucilaginibacter sp.]
MNKLKLTLWVFLSFFIVQSCKQKTGPVQQEDMGSGSATFAVDESFAPIVDQEKYVFTQLNVNAKPTMVYKSENEVLRLLLNDSVRMAILSRDLTPDEKKVLVSRTLTPEVSRFAIDAVALIVNSASTDTLITIADLKKILNGDTKTTKSIVFDNPNSSLVRYLKTFAGVKDFNRKNIYSLKNNKEVIKYISKNHDAIGIVGFSWLDDPDDDYADAVRAVKVVGIKDESSKTAPNQYFTPSQNTLALKQYPLTRGLYVINATGKFGIGTGFAHFMLSDKGQRIILRSGLLPDSIPVREINIKHTY